MSKRLARKRKAPPATNDISAAYYLGYAEDGESVEAIMKKFEELEKFQKEVSCQDSPKVASSSVSMNCTEIGASQDGADATMNQSQLEELFKRTSAFTVKTVAQSDMMLGTEEFDEMELWRLEYGDYPGELEEENDYEILDDDEDGLGWNEDAPKIPKARRERERAPKSRSTSSKATIDKETLLDRYKVMQVPVQDKSGNFFWMRKKVSLPDPNLPTYIRIPSSSMPRSWIKTILPLSIVQERNSGISLSGDILTMDLKPLGNAFQAILMDPPLQLPDSPMDPNCISIEQLASLDISSIITHGFLFVWVEKEFLPDVLRVGQQWGFRYVENLAWIKMNLNNKIACQSSPYFSKSKTTCLVLRKEGEIELRHQRNADCEFDFIKPSQHGSLNEEKPQFIYQVIETLLPHSINQAEKGCDTPRLLELWARPGHQRTGWSSITQNNTN